MMKEHPIIFNESMVRAVLDGRKTQTRRVIATPPYEVWDHGGSIRVTRPRKFSDEYCRLHPADCPYGESGDVLWVRETWSDYNDLLFYKASYQGNSIKKWKPSIHMPRSAARIFLEVKRIRVGQLQDISEKDAESEGVIFEGYSSVFGESINSEFWSTGIQDLPFSRTPKKSFENLWNHINAKNGYPWDSNPWVWVIDFEKVQL